MKKNKIDLVLAVCITILIMFGLVMVFGASSIMANTIFGSLTHFFRKQVLWALVTIGLMIFVSKVDYRIIKKDGRPIALLLLSILLLFGLFFLGKEINGAKRWYSLGFINFQPSELARLSLIIYLAYALSGMGHRITHFKEGLLPKLILITFVLVPVLLQPDMSTSLMIALVAMVMLYLSGAHLRHLTAVVLPIIPVLVFIMQRNSYQWQRIINWLASIRNPLEAAYQVKQSMIGLGRGGWTGVGIGESKQKFFFLPDSHTDFIFSIIGEEFGFIGTSIVLFLFIIILFRGMRLAKITKDPFGQLLAAGITANIVLYALINTAVVSNMAPATGLPMPFISYGGSHMVFLGISAGILLNISRHSGTQSWEEFRNQRETLSKTVIESD